MRPLSLLLCAVAWAAAAGPGPGAANADPAKVADPRFSTVTPVLVGCASGDAMVTRCPGTGAPTLGFVVAPRDINNLPLYGKDVEIWFDAPGVRFDVEQEAGCTLDCTNKILHKVVDLTGKAVFHPRFGGFTNGGNVTIGAEGVVLAMVPARSTDLDGLDGTTGLGDFTLFAPLYVAASTTHPEADFDASGGPIGLGDLTIFAREYLGDAHATYCP